MSRGLELRADAVGSGVTVLDLRGELDLASAAGFARKMSRTQEQCRCVVLDLSGLTFMDSTGLGLLMSGLRTATRDGGCLLVATPNATVMRVFTMSGLSETFEIHKTREAAVAAARDRAG